MYHRYWFVFSISPGSARLTDAWIIVILLRVGRDPRGQPVLLAAYYLLSSYNVLTPTIMNWQSSNVAGHTKKSAVRVFLVFNIRRPILTHFADCRIYDSRLDKWKHRQWYVPLVGSLAHVLCNRSDHCCSHHRKNHTMSGALCPCSFPFVCSLFLWPLRLHISGTSTRGMRSGG